MTNVRCGFTMNALTSQKPCMKLCKIQTVPGFARNTTFSIFADSFFDDQLNLENQNRFDPLTKEKKTRSSSNGTNKNNFVSGLKFISMYISSINF